MKKKNIPLFILEMAALYVIYFVLILLGCKYYYQLKTTIESYMRFSWYTLLIPLVYDMFRLIISILFVAGFSKITKQFDFIKYHRFLIRSGIVLLTVVMIYTSTFIHHPFNILGLYGVYAIRTMALGGVMQIAAGTLLISNSKSKEG